MKNNLILFLFILFFPSLLFSKWIYDQKCHSHLNYSLPIFHKLFPNSNVWNILHTCSNNEILNYSLLIPPNYSPDLLKWNEYNSNEIKLLYLKLFSNLNNKKIYLFGDSLMYQVLVSIILFFYSIGIKCLPKTIESISFQCSNGLEISRPLFISKLDENSRNLIYSIINQSDISIINVGHHYYGIGTMSCYQNNNNNYNNNKITPICSDIKIFFNYLQTNFSNTKIAWLDPFIPHFPIYDGTYSSWKKAKKYHLNSTCRPTEMKLTLNSPIYDGTNLIEKKYGSKYPVIRTYDLLWNRSDIHQGLITHRDPKRLDCVHLCLQFCFWEPILYRIGQTILSMMLSSSPSSTSTTKSTYSFCNYDIVF